MIITLEKCDTYAQINSVWDSVPLGEWGLAPGEKAKVENHSDVSFIIDGSRMCTRGK